MIDEAFSIKKGCNELAHIINQEHLTTSSGHIGPRITGQVEDLLEENGLRVARDRGNKEIRAQGIPVIENNDPEWGSSSGTLLPKVLGKPRVSANGQYELTHADFNKVDGLVLIVRDREQDDQVIFTGIAPGLEEDSKDTLVYARNLLM